MWDSVADWRFMKRFVDVYMKLWYAQKPTIAAVQGWCIGGGTDMVLCADMIVAGEGARFGYPPSRVWGTPTTAMWVYRMGLERAKRYLLTGDEIPGASRRRDRADPRGRPGRPAAGARARARPSHGARAAEPARHAQAALQPDRRAPRHAPRPGCSGTLFDGIARHTQEGLDFVRRSQDVGFRQAVRERDDPFGDYGSRKRD